MLDDIHRPLAFWSSLFMVLIVLGGLFVMPVFLYYSHDLPDHTQLSEYDPPTITRLYSSEGELMAEYAKEKRVYTRIQDVPQLVIDAFLAAEDRNYYQHSGVDIFSIGRAVVQNIVNVGRGKNPVGGSTITQQVVKNFLLTNERTLSRKIKEAILAYRISKAYSKERILELYLNQIYLGNGSYGIASAALNYFDKDLEDLTIEEGAMLAALPKAPSILDPNKNPYRALQRRNWVIDGMLAENFITEAQAEKAKEVPVKLQKRSETMMLDDGYYTESVRRELVAKYGVKNVYEKGLAVHTNLDKDLQKLADNALQTGLLNYDRRHGWRGPLTNIKLTKKDEWKQIIKDYQDPPGAGQWHTAIVIGVKPDKVAVGFKDGSKGIIPLKKLRWARKWLKDQYLGPIVKSAKDVLSIGDIVLVSEVKTKKKEKIKTYALEQIPNVNGALVAIEPKTGKVLAMAGGYSFEASSFNRAIQAKRQPGSAFKPFVYLAAVESGFAPNSIVMDEPIEIEQGPGMPIWAPKNYADDFLGPITIRRALEKSRNVATVRLLTVIGLEKVIDIAERLGIYKKPPAIYSMALGAYETTLMDLTAAYATIANGGSRVVPSLIDRVHTRRGKIVYSSDTRNCAGCKPLSSGTLMYTHLYPKLEYTNEFIIDQVDNYQILSMLEGAVVRGTARRARGIGKTVAGKTGTTNDSNDAWFVGFSPDLVCGVYIGFDNPRSLGDREQGASAALPIFIDFMKKAIKDVPDRRFDIPGGIEFVEIDMNTGTLPDRYSKPKDIIQEAMKASDIYDLGHSRRNIEGMAPHHHEDHDHKSTVDDGFGGVY